MKYSIEITDNGYVETLEVNGKEYKKHWTSANGCSICSDDDFCEQMQADGYSEEIVDSICESIDGSFFADEFESAYKEIMREEV